MDGSDSASPQRWPELEEANQAELLAYFATSPIAKSQVAGDLTWVMSGVDNNTYNGVFGSRLPDAQADQVIGEVVERFRVRNLPALWHVDRHSQPADLAQRLQAHGCSRLRAGVCMAMDLSKIKEPVSNVPGLVIQRVSDSAGLAAWMDVWMHFDDGPRQPRERLYLSLGLGNRPLRHYLARLHRQPVAVSQLFLGREAAGLYCVATLPEMRRRGIGTAIILAPLYDARELGHRAAVLARSREGQQLYRRIGFELYSNAGLYFVL